MATETVAVALPEPLAVIAIDVGGSSIKGAVVTGDAALFASRRATTPHASESALVDAVVAVTLELAELAASAGSPATAIGVSAAGVIDEGGGIARRGANLRWRNTALSDRLEQSLGVPATLVQDARAAAHGEAIFGAGRGADSFLSVILGTGVGSAVVLDGRPIRGSHGLAGEIGHLQVEPGGIVCGCGGRGCVETLASAAALSRRFEAATGEPLPAEGVIARVRGGDPVARRLWSEAVSALAQAVAAAVAVVDCDLVILGGGMAAAGPLLLRQLRTELDRRLAPLAPPPALALAALGNAAGVLGAAAAALDMLGRDDVIRSWRALPVDGLVGTDPFDANEPGG